MLPTSLWLCFRSVQRKVSKRFLPYYLLTGLIAFTILLIWTTGFHTFVCTSSVRVSLNEARQFQVSSSMGRKEAESSDDAARNCDCEKLFETGIGANDTAYKHMFRSNFPLEDSQLVEGSSYFKLRDEAVNPLMKNYLIEPQDLCNGTGGAPFLLVMIPSLSHHTSMRKTIRSTWGSVVHTPWPGTTNLPSVRIVFVFGRTETEEEEFILEAESVEHGDVLYVDFADSYRNLTYKSLTSLHWAATRCTGASFVMKVDEDTFVNVPYLMEFLHYHRRELNRTVVGYANAKPVCVRTGKWAVNFNAYPLSVFPRYFYGHSYVISGDLVKDMAVASEHMPFIPVEDASVTGVMAYMVNATRLHNSLFAVARRSYTCAIVKNVKITITLISESNQMRIWNAVQHNRCSYVIFQKPSDRTNSRRKDMGSANSVKLVRM